MNSILVQEASYSSEVDRRVQEFLAEHRGQWHNQNVPYQDGRVLYDLIVRNRHRRALEIGTSTGHSTIWIAWALSKTGGRLITIEIDEGRYRTALKNFKRAGVEEFIDARLGNALQLVRDLEGPFDFVFCDADEVWYATYFKEVEPKLAKGGCFAAHNVTDPFVGVEQFLAYVRRQTDYETTIDRSSSRGISVSCKKTR
ncbi:MAG: methyltransferase [Deltaproteobacteria bacterium RBG_13_52_11b]|nr:MAG: methyltransferase [Deltaproteobacteria bacterium RBG_13_52_11b]